MNVIINCKEAYYSDSESSSVKASSSSSNLLFSLFARVFALKVKIGRCQFDVAMHVTNTQRESTLPFRIRELFLQCPLFLLKCRCCFASLFRLHGLVR